MTAMTMERIKKGRRKIGAYFSMPGGRQVLVARRRHKDIYRAGRKSISEALREGVGGWVLDMELLTNARARGVTTVIVAEIDTRTMYVTNINNFYDLKRASIRSSGQRCLPIAYWEKRLGRVLM